MVTFLKKKNNAGTTLSADVTVNATSIAVVSASSFPTSGSFHITIWDNNTYENPGNDANMEVLKVTGISGNIFTVERAKESTVAVAHNSGNTVQLLLTAGLLEDIEEQIEEVESSIPVALSELTEDATHRIVTDTEKSTWNAKQDALIADTDYLTPGTASSTYEPVKGEDDNYVTDAEKTVIGNTSGSNSGDDSTPAETPTTIGNLINGSTDKETPVDADYVGVMDSVSSNILKKLSWANIKAALKIYFDAIYTTLASVKADTDIAGAISHKDLTDNPHNVNINQLNLVDVNNIIGMQVLGG